MNRDEALQIYRRGLDVVVTTLVALSQEVKQHQKENIKLKAQIKKLEGQLAKNSRNSSKPPSSDGPKKPPRSTRPRGKRKPGGQKGHPGSTLEMTDDPHHKIIHPVHECEQCQCSLNEQSANNVEKRQVFDLPPPTGLEVTEHQAEIKQCPQCGHTNKASFPSDVNAPVQYGPRVKATASYLREYQLLPFARTCELLQDMFCFSLSEGTLNNILKSLDEKLEDPVDYIAESIKNSRIVNFDETSCSVQKKRWWLHVASTSTLTYYQVHKKRGSDATDDIGILPEFSGRAIHDHWKPYFKYSCDHGLCNAHHLRELTYIHEEHDQKWAKEMVEYLCEVKKAVDETRPTNDHLAADQIAEFEARYHQILGEGYHENPLPAAPAGEPKKRGRPKKSKSRNLLERLDAYQRETLAFMYDFTVPFDNNQAERDVRMTKVQQKISGTFRSQRGATTFCRIRSYIGTARKNAINAIDAIYNAFIGKPYMPPS
jgi:transposase